jgi:hypothetical protein
VTPAIQRWETFAPQLSFAPQMGVTGNADVMAAERGQSTPRSPERSSCSRSHSIWGKQCVQMIPPERMFL